MVVCVVALGAVVCLMFVPKEMQKHDFCALARDMEAKRYEILTVAAFNIHHF